MAIARKGHQIKFEVSRKQKNYIETMKKKEEGFKQLNDRKKIRVKTEVLKKLIPYKGEGKEQDLRNTAGRIYLTSNSQRGFFLAYPLMCIVQRNVVAWGTGLKHRVSDQQV